MVHSAIPVVLGSGVIWHMTNCQMVGTGTANPPLRATVGKQEDRQGVLAAHHSAPAERRPNTIYSDTLQRDRGEEVFHL